jgi:hypothetical protein
VPERNRLFPDVPAEQHLPAVSLRREVEQPEVEILELDAELLEPLDARDRGVGESHELGLRGVQVARRIAAAVPADRDDELALGLFQLAHACAHRDEPLRHGAHLVQGVVSLVGSERPVGHRAAS